MKLLLTSTGLSSQNIANQFLQLINKPISKVSVLFIPTAARSKRSQKYVEMSRNELISLGITTIITHNLDHLITNDDLAKIDIIYVCGGNTFYLLKKMRESGFDKIIRKFNGIYIGVSAGSNVAGPDISIATPYDENDVELTDLEGLHLTDIIVSPHYTDNDKKIVDSYRKKLHYKIIPLTDSQALLYIDGKIKIVE